MQLGTVGDGADDQLRDDRMKIAFVHQPWNRIVHGAPQGSVPIWTSEISRRLGRDHEVFLYSRRFRDQRECEVAEGLNLL